MTVGREPRTRGLRVVLWAVRSAGSDEDVIGSSVGIVELAWVTTRPVT